MQVLEYQQMKDIQERNAATIINVLPAEKFSQTHIPGSINIPLTTPDFATQVSTVVGGRDLPIVVYCASKDCDASKKAAKKLDDAGFLNVMCYEGGAKEWYDKNPGRSAA